MTTRDRLLERTVDVIDSAGVPAVRVHLIAEAAGVKVPAVYYFFGSKEGLIEAAQAERYSRSLLESTAEFLVQMDGISDAAGFREACRQSMVAYFSAAGAHRRLVRINALGSGYASPDLLTAINDAQSRANREFAHILKVAQDNGWIRAGVDTTALAAWFTGQLLGRTLIEIGPSDVDPDRWNEISIEAAFAVAFEPDDRG